MKRGRGGWEVRVAWGLAGGEEEKAGAAPMLFNRHVYSSWSVRQVAATCAALSSPTCFASSEAMEEVDRMVP